MLRRYPAVLISSSIANKVGASVEILQPMSTGQCLHPTVPPPKHNMASKRGPGTSKRTPTVLVRFDFPPFSPLVRARNRDQP
jgi:hypothetical protein